MSSAPTQQVNRLDRRKARTRAALIAAAQMLIAEGRTNVPVLEITQAADVGMGSFYNHFETKEQLFEAAVEAVMDAYGQLLDNLTTGIEDPAEVFACSFRLTGRLFRTEPSSAGFFSTTRSGCSAPKTGWHPAFAGTSRPRRTQAASTSRTSMSPSP